MCSFVDPLPEGLRYPTDVDEEPHRLARHLAHHLREMADGTDDGERSVQIRMAAGYAEMISERVRQIRLDHGSAANTIAALLVCAVQATELESPHAPNFWQALDLETSTIMGLPMADRLAYSQAMAEARGLCEAPSGSGDPRDESP